MSIYLRWGGAILIMLSALWLSRAYRDYLDKGVRELRGFISLITHIEAKVGCFLTPSDGLWSTFSDTALVQNGFLSALESGKTLSEAFEDCSSSLTVRTEERELLSDFFSSFGTGYRDTETNRCQRVLKALSTSLSSYEERAEKDKSIASALLLGGALAIVIMII